MINTEGYFLTKTGIADDAFELRPFELPEPSDDEVIVEVEAFGLNYADVMARKGLYHGAPPLPCVIGYEVVGKIIGTGSEESKQYEGKRVAAFCRFGGYAKHVITRKDACVVVQDEPAEELLGLCTQGVTAYYMSYHLINLHKTDNVLIHAAAGGVGSILIQLAKNKGARVIAKVGTDEKIVKVKSLGADFAVNYNKSDYHAQVKRFLNGEQLDVSFNPAAGSTFKKDMSLLGAGGRIVLFGASELGKGKFGIFSKLNFLRKMGLIIPVGLMMKSKSILGANMLEIGDHKPDVMKDCLGEVVSLYREGKIKPQVSGVYPANQLSIAHAALESGKTMGKLAIKW